MGVWQLHGNDAADLWRWRMREMKGRRGGQTDRRWLRKRGENGMQSGRNPDTGRLLALTAAWLDGWSETQGE